jgi:LSD1 subclass zinc finger protein
MALPPDAEKPGVKFLKLEMTCSTCQAPLPVSPGSRIVVCDYCGVKTTVPDEIWNAISPRAPQQPFPSLPGPALPQPAVPQKKTPVVLFIAIALILLTFAVPVIFGLCGACIPFVMAIFSVR